MADSATSRFSAPLIDPSARPSGAAGAADAHIDRVAHRIAAIARPLHQAGAAAELHLIRECGGQRVAKSRARRPLKPHCTPSRRANSRVVWTMRASISTCGSRPIERRDQRRRSLEAVGQVLDDDGVGPRVELDRAALRQDRRRDQLAQIRGLRVAERPRQHLQLAGERLRIRQFATLFFFGGQHRQRRDANDRAVDDVAKLVRAQDDVERLIPRHIAKRHVDGALDASDR